MYSLSRFWKRFSKVALSYIHFGYWTLSQSVPSAYCLAVKPGVEAVSSNLTCYWPLNSLRTDSIPGLTARQSLREEGRWPATFNSCHSREKQRETPTSGCQRRITNYWSIVFRTEMNQWKDDICRRCYISLLWWFTNIVEMCNVTVRGKGGVCKPVSFCNWKKFISKELQSLFPLKSDTFFHA